VLPKWKTAAWSASDGIYQPRQPSKIGSLALAATVFSVGQHARKPSEASRYRTGYTADHTGYAQVLEETTCNLNTPTQADKIQYTLGDDILSQKLNDNSTQYLLYDGHGSTRQLVNTDLSIQDSYNYDGYGVLLQNDSAALQLNPGVTPQQATNYLWKK